MELTQVLEATLSPDSQTIRLAEEQLQKAAQTNLAEFLTALSGELADIGKTQTARVAAGLQLKNYLTSKNPTVRLQYQQAWFSFEPNVRQVIKTNVIRTLGTETEHYRSAAQCVAYIAATEIPQNLWPEVIPTLVANVTNMQATEALKESSLEALGYICEELDARFLASQSNEILTAIVQGMRKEEQSNRVKLAATKALLNSLEFTKANFEKEAERHFIMQVVCEATQCNYVPVQVAALQNLVKIMSLYYQYMEAYMGPALFAITLAAMKSDVNEIALQGIEFWSTVCDEETDLAIEAAEAEEQGRPPEQVSRFYVKGALNFLIDVLLQTLTKQDEFDDEDDWNPCKAAGVCLSLMAGCCENAIVEPVIKFVMENLAHAEWNHRDAAIMALGSVLEGPDPSILKEPILKVTGSLITLMDDSNIQVKDSAAWTLGRVCEHVPEAVLNEQYLLPLLKALVGGLKGEPRVATNVCWALASLAEAAHEATGSDDDPPTYHLSPHFGDVIKSLVETADRDDANLNNLRSSAYEAIMDLIKYSAKDCYAVVQQTALEVMKRLDHVIQLDSQVDVVGSDRQQLADLASLLCATLQSLLRKISSDDAKQISDMIMRAIYLMLNSKSAQAGGVQEDAIMTVGVLVEAIGENFDKYMAEFSVLLFASLQNITVHQVCLAAVGLVGDLCRALSVKILPYTEQIMKILVEILSNAEVHRSVKPPILSTIGDIALAIGPEFKNYLGFVCQILQQASQMAAPDKRDFDMVDYINELREGCLEAYTGIVQGLKGDNEKQPNPDVNLVWPQVPVMVQLIHIVGSDDEHSDSLVASAAGLLGDLCSSFGKNLLPVMSNAHAINELLKEGKRSRIKRTKTLSVWAAKELKTIQS